MNTTENNKLIAEFLGFEEFYNNHYRCLIKLYENDSILPPQYMKFHTNWNWLMLVVEKIENTKIENLIFDVSITKNKTHIHYSKNKEWYNNVFLYQGKTKIENTYIACVEFIKWYNQQK